MKGEIYSPGDGNHTPDDQGHKSPDKDMEGRPLPSTMTDRAILEELLTSQRKVADLVNGFFADLKGGKINPLQMMGGIFKR